MIWCSKLQTETALSTAEAKNIAMSHALHETIPVQNHIKEINCMFDLPNPMTGFCITLNENNLLAIAIAESLKFAPRTKHSHQISSFLQPSEYIFWQVRWHQDQVHINQEAYCWHIHLANWCWQFLYFTQNAKWMVIISITLRFHGSVRMQASSSNSVFHLCF